MPKSKMLSRAEIAKMSPEKVQELMEARISDIGRETEKHAKLASDIGDIGLDVDIAGMRLSDIQAHQEAMQASICELVVGLDVSVNAIDGHITSLQQATVGEKLVGYFSKSTANDMREKRIRGANLRTNLNNLLAKSDRIAAILKEQLNTISGQQDVISQSLQSVSEEREQVIEEMTGLTGELDGLTAEINHLQEKVAAETDLKVRSKLETEYRELVGQYEQKKTREQELLAASNTLEKHAKNYEIYRSSLNDQAGAQRTLITVLEKDTVARINQWDALVESMKTAAIQESAHAIREVGAAVDRKAIQIVASVAAASQDRLSDMLNSHHSTLAFQSKVEEEREIARDKFENLLSDLLEKHQAGRS
ncbi:hypothetical protein [Thalassospira xiamenensis]|uniref:Uncharacterized protein n=1 Tax=Thalassospira xiamenensis TaxID=220697 RepID=A0A285TS84_9PROT|nr:hypothetical protein [Thalassospira xiamenensis]SOC26656.1 hypothetical protein SAMN05428964_105157 [Thalassospira xiamenensis]